MQPNISILIWSGTIPLKMELWRHGNSARETGTISYQVLPRNRPTRLTRHNRLFRLGKTKRGYILNSMI